MYFKKYSWKPNLPKTKVLADVCKHIIQDTVTSECHGPCDDFNLILSSCEDDYDKANALQFPDPICVSICGPTCDYYIALFTKMDNLLTQRSMTSLGQIIKKERLYI